MAPGDSRHRILVVDDSAVHREVVRGILAQDGYEILEATDGIEGITRALQELPDLVVSDVVMPDISGYQVCRFLKHDRLTSRIPIILMTATEVAKQHRFWGLRSGADRYLVKEGVGEDLRQEVAGLLRQVAPGSVRNGAANRYPPGRRRRDVRSELAFLLDDLLFRTTIAQEVHRLASYVHDPDKCFHELAALASDLADFSCLCLHLAGVDGSQLHFAVRTRITAAQLQQAREVAAERFGRNDPLEDSEGLIRPSVSQLVDEQLPPQRFASHCSYPLQLHLGTMGSMSVYFDHGMAMTSQVREQMRTLAQQFTPVARLVVMCRETQRLSLADSLTMLFSARHFEQRLVEAFDHYQRFRRPYAVLLIDVDYFKQINDHHGHPVGDIVLRQLANVLRAAARQTDVVARHGGDEFALLMPDTALSDAVTIGKAIQNQVTNMAFGDSTSPLRVTVSIGVAEASARCTHAGTVVAQAGEAQDEARQAGGNAVQAFLEGSQTLSI